MEEDLRGMAERLRDLKLEKKGFEDDVKECNKEIEVLEAEISDVMFKAGQSKATFTGIGTISPTLAKYPRVIDKEVFFDYLEKSGQAGMIQETVNGNTLRSWFNQKAFTDEETEDLGLEYYEKVKISLRSN